MNYGRNCDFCPAELRCIYIAARPTRLVTADLPLLELDVEQRSYTFRPIRASDEELWYNFILNCSKHTIYSRYQHAMSFSRQDVTKLCQPDESEIAYVMVASTQLSDLIVGEVRLYRDNPQGSEAEFAILVADAWQNKGIGSVMTQEIIAIAKERGITKIVAYTDNDNGKMLRVFQKMGFDKNSSVLSQEVDLVKHLDV